MLASMSCARVVLQMLTVWRLACFVPCLKVIVPGHSFDGIVLRMCAIEQALAVTRCCNASNVDTSPPCLQKPYKDQLERMLVEYVEPAFRSPHGHLRAKACWVAGTYADIQFEGGAGKGRTFQLLMRHVIQALQDPELPVRALAGLDRLHSGCY